MATMGTDVVNILRGLHEAASLPRSQISDLEWCASRTTNALSICGSEAGRILDQIRHLATLRTLLPELIDRLVAGDALRGRIDGSMEARLEAAEEFDRAADALATAAAAVEKEVRGE